MRLSAPLRIISNLSDAPLTTVLEALGAKMTLKRLSERVLDESVTIMMA